MALTVTVISDLHIEARPLRIDEILDPDVKSDVLCLLGDIGDPTSQAYHDLLAAMSARFPTVLLLAGNNEYRNHGGSDRTMDQTEEAIRRAAAPFPNVRFLQNETQVVGDVAFIGTTLWSYLPDDPLPRQEEGEAAAAAAAAAGRLAAAVTAAVPPLAGSSEGDASRMVVGCGDAADPSARTAAATAVVTTTAPAHVAATGVRRSLEWSQVTHGSFGECVPATGTDARGDPASAIADLFAGDSVVTVCVTSTGRAAADGARGELAATSSGKLGSTSPGKAEDSAGRESGSPRRPSLDQRVSVTAFPSGKPPAAAPVTVPRRGLANTSPFYAASRMARASAASSGNSSGDGSAPPSSPAAATPAIPVSGWGASRRGGPNGEPPAVRAAARSQPISSPLHLLRWRNCAAYGVGGSGAEGAAECGGGDRGSACSRLLLRHSISLSSLRPEDPLPSWRADLESFYTAGDRDSGSASGSASGSTSSSESENEREKGGRRKDDSQSESDALASASSDETDEADSALVSNASMTTASGDSAQRRRRRFGLLPDAPRSDVSEAAANPVDAVQPCGGTVLAAPSAPASAPQPADVQRSGSGGAPLACVAASASPSARKAESCIPSAAATAAPLLSAPPAPRSHSHRSQGHRSHHHHHSHDHSRHASSSAAAGGGGGAGASSAAAASTPPLPPATIREYIGATSLDYRRIYLTPGGPPITTDVTNALFTASLEYIQAAVAAARSRGLVPVVLTHHAPSMSGTSRPKFAGHPSTHAYGTDLLPYLETSGIAVWYCGHTHYNFDVELKGGARLASNQFGSQPQPAEGYSRSWQQVLPGKTPGRALPSPRTGKSALAGDEADPTNAVLLEAKVAERVELDGLRAVEVA